MINLTRHIILEIKLEIPRKICEHEFVYLEKSA